MKTRRWFASTALVALTAASVLHCGGSDGGEPATAGDASTSALPETGALADAGATSANDGEAGRGAASCEGVLYCEDFEAYDSTPMKDLSKLGPWSVRVGSTTTMTVDSVRPYTGQKALHIAFPPGTGGGTLQQTPDGGVIPGENMFGRAMFNFAQTPGDGGAGLPGRVHSFFFMSKGRYAPLDAGITFDVAESQDNVFVNYFPPNRGEENVYGGKVTPGAWHCLQWEADGSGNPAANHAQIWLDGQLVNDIPQTKGWVFATPWTLFTFGFSALQAEGNAIDVTLDTFALDDKMIPCP